MTKYNFARDFEVFQKHLPSLIRDHRGKFAVLHNGEVREVFEKYDDGIHFGAREFKMGRFSIQEVKDGKPDVLSYSLLV